jgi:large subunit ribosomal protein L18
MSLRSRSEQRCRRHERIRRRVHGTAAKPRMAIMISNKHMYVQFVDDERGATLASVTTCGKEGVKHNVQAAGQLGREAAEAAARAGVRLVVVDRGGFAFHGRVKAIVDSAVAAGLAISAAREEK